MAEIKIDIAPPELFSIGEISISNAMFGLWLSILFIFFVGVFVRKNAGVIPSRVQVIVEVLMDFVFEKMSGMFGGEEKARKFFPLIFTIFIMLLVSNQLALVPFVESITLGGAPSFRAPASHFSMPIALALIVLILANGLAFFKAPLTYLNKFFPVGALLSIKKAKDVPMALLNFVLGPLDVVGELAKVISLPARLFGNIIAGQAIYIVLINLFVFTQFLIPIPFLALGVLSGLVQALVFGLLASIYISQSLEIVEAKN
jgi:F-type H+-transporting ATPase subunit a